MPGVLGVHHVAVSVPDLDAARDFYIGLLGGVEQVAPLEWRDNPMIDRIVGLEGSAARQFFCRLGNIDIEVFEYLAPRSAPQDPDRGVHNFGYTHFAIQVEDLAAAHARLVEAGIRVHAPPSFDGITTAADGSKQGYCGIYCRDPFGNVFELLEIHPTEAIKPI